MKKPRDEFHNVPWRDGGKKGANAEVIGRVLWQGRQWVVTTLAVCCWKHGYVIDANRLLQDEPHYSWAKHMLEKDWVDQEDFQTAFRIAKHLFHGRPI